MSDSTPDRSKWPPHVKPISYGDMGWLGVGSGDHLLYWDGKPIELQRRFKFSRLQAAGAVIIGLAMVIGGVGTGINEGFDFGCKVHLWSDGCRP